MSAATNGIAAAGGPKQQLKSNVGGKALDSTRKQAGSPIDGQNKKIAWDNTNAAIRNTNGSVKPRSPAPSQPQNKREHERTVFLYSQMIGQDVTITLTSGEQLTGVYSGTSASFDQHIIKMAKRIRQAGQAHINGNANSDFVGTGPDHELGVHMEGVADLAVPNLKLAAGPSQQNGSVGFRTDMQISSQASQAFGERELQRWQPDLNTDVDMSLESSSGTQWDQFEANKQLYGVDTTYDENIYTTAIDKSNPKYRQRELEASRLAAEIERSAPANSHVAAERKRDAQHDDDGGDEEDKYSGVLGERGSRSTRAPGAYVPPAQRPITGTPTVSGAPFDPAIISATPSVIASPAETQKLASRPAVSAAPEPQATSTATTVGQANQGPENHVAAARDAFKQFANNEKLRVKQAQEAKRNNNRQEKNVKLNDLKKFAANFKLKSRVPDDLVPILAKDREKQVEIQTKAEQAAKEAELRSKDKNGDNSSTIVSPTPSAGQSHAAPAASIPTFNQQGRKGVQPLHSGPQLSQGHSQHVPPNAQLQSRQHQRPQPLPANLRMPSGPQSSAAETPLSPASVTSGKALNVNAPSFKFRPGAHDFAPTGSSPSPQHTASGVGPSPPTPNQALPSFFDAKKTKETVPLASLTDAVTALFEGDYTEEQKKKYVGNGGVPNSFFTPVTWSTTKTNENVTHEAAFPRLQPVSQGPSPMQTPIPNQMSQQLPQHGMPLPVMPMHNQRQGYYGPQSGHMPGYPGPSMPGQFPQHSSMQNSPRMPNMPPFNGQVPMQQPFQGQVMPGYAASPSMGHRQPMPPNGMMPYQQQGQMMHQQRQGYPGPGYPAQQMGGQMMMPNPSAGGYNGPVPNYSPMPHQAQPHMPFAQHGPGQFVGGSPRTYPMSQQGSQQGYQPQPPLAGQHPYHYQRTMSGGYPQVTPRQQTAMPHHGSPGMGPAQGDEGK